MAAAMRAARLLAAGPLAAVVIAASAPALAAPLEFSSADERIGFAASDIRGVDTGADEWGMIGLTVCLEHEAAQRLAAFTERSINRKIEMWIGGIMVIAPTVREPIYGGCAVVNGMTDEEAATYRDTLIGAAAEP